MQSNLYDECRLSAQRLVHTLRTCGLTISAAESCTGGLLCELITSVAGASEVFECGICSYSNKIKHNVLGVPTCILDKYTELSCETAGAMAQGARALSGADISISTTGVAGPSGGSAENPVGTVYVAFCTAEGTTAQKRYFNNENGTADRDTVRLLCAKYCLDKAVGMLSRTRGGNFSCAGNEK